MCPFFVEIIYLVLCLCLRVLLPSMTPPILLVLSCPKNILFLILDKDSEELVMLLNDFEGTTIWWLKRV